MTNIKRDVAESGSDSSKKLPYSSPTLTRYGSVKDLTRNGTGTGTDGTADPTMAMVSDPALKENVVRVGDHHLGFGLYLFDYKAGYSDRLGRQFGVMADEVEQIVPEAVSIGTNGYRQVDYAKLGIVLH